MITIKYFDGNNKLIIEQTLDMLTIDINQYLNWWISKLCAKKISVHDDKSNLFILKAV